MIIVAAVDGSDYSERVVERAVDVARKWDAELHVIHVAHLSGVVASALATALADEEDIERKLSDAVWNRVQPLLDAHDGLHVHRIDRRGYAGDEIADYAKEVDAALVVLGSHGWGGFKAAVLGSTSMRVIQRSPCDVLVVRS